MNTQVWKNWADEIIFPPEIGMYVQIQSFKKNKILDEAIYFKKI